MTMQVVPIDVFPLIDRAKMPQIDVRMYTDMLIFLGSKGLSFNAGYINPTELHLHQEVDVAKAMQLTDEILKRPLLIAVDNFVLDGDHRGYRHYVNKTLAPFIRINTSFYNAFQMLREFPGTYSDLRGSNILT